MAEVESAKVPSLAEQYVLPKDAKIVQVSKVVKESDKESTAAEESAGDASIPAEESVETPAVIEEVTEETKVEEDTPEVTAGITDESSVANEEEKSVDQEEVAEENPEVKLETAPADFRFPTTNQTRHCFTRYVEYHRCVAAKGDGAPECDKFAKYYRSLCPGEW